MLVGDTVEVPDGEPAVAQRFLIAHELGHWHLRHKVAEGKIEREANAFASELLVPRDELRGAAKARPTLVELRRHFNVSRDVIVYALMDARLINSVRPA
jgi:Zn-dependent peptidase ImmA (M78 family)